MQQTKASMFILSMQHAWVKFGWLLLLIVALMGLPKLNLQPSIQAYFSKNDPELVALSIFEQQFGADANLQVLFIGSQSWTSPNQLALLQSISQQLLLLEGVETVSPTTDLALQSALPPTLAKQLVSEDGLSVLLSLNVAPNIAEQAKLVPELFSQLDTVLQEFAAEGVSYQYAGELALSQQYLKVLKHDLSWFAPALIISFALLFTLVIRNLRWLAAMASCAFFSLLLTLGLSGWLGLKLAAISAFIPLVIISLIMAYCSHLYFAWREQLVVSNDSYQAILGALEHKFSPLLWGALTTAAGFLLLNLSPSPPIADFGLMVAFSVLVNGLACCSLLPWWLKGITCSKNINTKQPAKLVNFSLLLKYRRVILLAALVVSLVAGWAVSQLRFDDDPLNYFKADNAFSLSRDKLQQQFLGLHSVRYQLNEQSDDPLARSEPLSRLLGYLNQQAEVRQVNSKHDWLDWFAQDPTAIMSMSTVQQSGLDLAKQAELLTVWLQPLSNRQLIEFEQRVAQWAAAEQIQLSPAYSSNLIFAKFNQANGQAMLLSFSLAFLLVALVVLVLKRSGYLMLLALLANAIPLLWVFALWQLFGQHLSLGSAVVMGMMLGIIVDDSLHILLKVDPVRGGAQLQQGMASITPALLLTSGALTVGFALAYLSDFLPIQQMGLLSALTLLLALLVDLLILPLCLPHAKSRLSAELGGQP
ncbi:efflux RND transporter permease subunit [Agarivorans albus]|uniref:Predicted exporter of the RND superfamily n=1 Tax=Agarivorans albus MKT 106 TaxID=1331007 RepID=R9PRB8_AGAAL|nr:MMPL family transporter [Agarivorans albus]GAD00676.1 predicted exporter of the RND superfamily [Agarivorans albus MKT 106]